MEAAPDVERLHRREARQTGGERGGAVGADAVPTAGEQREQKSQGKERAGGSGYYYIITIIMRERGKEEAGAEKEGACPDHHLSAQTQQSRRQPGRTFWRESIPDAPAGRHQPADTLAPAGVHFGAGSRLLERRASYVRERRERKEEGKGEREKEGVF